MARFFKKREEIKGLSPGSLVFIGNKNEADRYLNRYEPDFENSSRSGKALSLELKAEGERTVTIWVH